MLMLSRPFPAYPQSIHPFHSTVRAAANGQMGLVRSVSPSFSISLSPPFGTAISDAEEEEEGDGGAAAARLSERNWRQQKSHIEGEREEAGRSFNEVLGLKWSQEMCKELVILVPICGCSNKCNSKVG